ncbi:Conserved_hypothetical protein [Hexamita inflata]|uniref:Uncharacterized protein n=1 Tax=Hexamita inflata TaxID=28002 RepID=A0AA86TKJ0_9EUKA|nr:Conserved hypothetical protein [Hexamita inflata]
MLPTWSDALRVSMLKYKMKTLPHEIDRLKSQNILRFSTAYLNQTTLDMIADAIQIGIKYLTEISIYFSTDSNESPFHPQGDHMSYLSYVKTVPGKYGTSKSGLPTQYETSEIFNELLQKLQTSLKHAHNLKILALYSPPTVNHDIAKSCPEQMDLFVIQSTRSLISCLPQANVIVLKNCSLNEENYHFILDALKDQNTSRQLIFKRELFRQFGPCHRHSDEAEICEHFTNKDKLLMKFQTDLPGCTYLDLSWNELSNTFLADFCKLLTDDGFVRIINLENNPFGNYIDRLVFSGFDDENPQTLKSFQVSEAASSYCQFLMTSFTPNFYQAPSSQTVKFLQTYCQNASELKELSELVKHPIVKMLEINNNIFGIRINNIGQALSKFINLRTEANQKLLFEAAEEKKEILEFAKLKIYQKELKDVGKLFKKFEQKIEKEQKEKDKKDDKKVKKSLSVKKEQKDTSRSASKSKTQPDSDLISIRENSVRDSSIYTAKTKQSRISKINNDSIRSTRSTSNTKQSNTTLTEKSFKTQSNQTTKSKKVIPKPVSSKREHSVKSVSEKSIKSEKSAKSTKAIKNIISENPAQIKMNKNKQKVMVDVEEPQNQAGFFNTEEEYEQFQQNQAENMNVAEAAQERLNDKIDTNAILDKIADETFDILVQLNNGDQVEARNKFNQKQLVINNFCQRLVKDVERGVVLPQNTEAELEVFLREI